MSRYLSLTPPPPPTSPQSASQPPTPPPFPPRQLSQRNLSPPLPTYRDNRKSAESDLVDLPPTHEETIQKLIEIQSRISNQLEQIATTMTVMSQTLNQRMDAEAYLVYRKIDRLAETLGVEEVDTSTIPFAIPKPDQKVIPSVKRSKSMTRK